MILFIVFVFMPFAIFIYGQVLIREENKVKDKKTGKILIITSIVFAIIGLGYCGMLL
ncbi:hypothetical protein [Aequorivita soesokkakensis]|uniref:hypothetical protein n=1 Tax=Aequorivita soesokkakensis TaxID=1385699 RepID=UPI0013F4E02C|nr:hypothetical protein [Aequorivita soesokkakensis]